MFMKKLFMKKKIEAITMQLLIQGNFLCVPFYVNPFTKTYSKFLNLRCRPMVIGKRKRAEFQINEGACIFLPAMGRHLYIFFFFFSNFQRAGSSERSCE